MGKASTYYKRAISRISINLKDIWSKLSWHFKNMYEQDYTSHFLNQCLEYDYHKITARAMPDKLLYRIRCWRDFKVELQFYVNHLDEFDIIRQTIIFLSVEKQVKDEHEKYMRLGTSLESQELEE